MHFRCNQKNTHTHSSAHTHSHTQARTHTLTRSSARTHTHTLKRAHTHTPSSARTHTAVCLTVVCQVAGEEGNCMHIHIHVQYVRLSVYKSKLPRLRLKQACVQGGEWRAMRCGVPIASRAHVQSMECVLLHHTHIHTHAPAYQVFEGLHKRKICNGW